MPAGRLVAIDPGRANGGTDVCPPLSLSPGPLRAQLTVEGVPLSELVPGTRLRVGQTAIVELLGDDQPSLPADPWRGAVIDASGDSMGASARVLVAGTIRAGDAVALEAVRVPLEDVLDLHPFRPDEIAGVVREYLTEVQAAGLGEVRLIHGRGRGVQREVVRRLLATLPIVDAFGDAPPERGGWGATVVRLRAAPKAPSA